ncbi:hypothetical protein E4U54_006792 [Claviceps lovelessii]|nr:hypothetical protein E4U54_006792 [Claviceps lovelessii]
MSDDFYAFEKSQQDLAGLDDSRRTGGCLDVDMDVNVADAMQMSAGQQEQEMDSRQGEATRTARRSKDSRVREKH